MIAAFLAACGLADRWLNQRFRAYGVVLTVGLVIEIVRRLAEVRDKLGEVHRLMGLVLLVLLNLALLIHQLGELGERFGGGREGAAGD